MFTLRVAANLVLLSLVGCGAAGSAPDRDAPLEPVLVEPRVPVQTVGDRLGVVQTPDAARILAYLDTAARPGQLAAADRAAIGQDGDTRCWSLPFHDAQKIAFVRRRSGHWWATTLPMGEHGLPVPPLTWISANIIVHRADEDAEKAWFREMSRRVATSGRASGLVVDEDGSANGIVLELHNLPDQGDAELVSQSLRMQPGHFDATAWGPVLTHTWGASSNHVNGRAGVAICDILALRPF